LLVLSVGYFFLLRNFNVPVLPGERHFGATGAVKPAAEVYIEPISIDAFNDAMQVRAYLEPSVSSSGWRGVAGSCVQTGRQATCDKGRVCALIFCANWMDYVWGRYRRLSRF
jgi:hypothetical protein